MSTDSSPQISYNNAAATHTARYVVELQQDSASNMWVKCVDTEMEYNCLL